MIESNKLMAEFLGYKYQGYDENVKEATVLGWRKDNCSFIHKTSIQGEIGERQFLCRNHRDLSFHKDWNWLMPVVEKIENNLVNFSIRGNMCRIEYVLSEKEDISILSETKIQAVYSACLQFIQNVTSNT